MSNELDKIVEDYLITRQQLFAMNAKPIEGEQFPEYFTINTEFGSDVYEPVADGIYFRKRITIPKSESSHV